jgi:hypothetical protein
MFQRTTKTGCINDILAALEVTSDAEIRNYIGREWLHISSQWALYARQHSPLLLQVTTTNPVEAWHRHIQYGRSNKGIQSKHRFKGCFITPNEKAIQLDSEGETAAFKCRGSSLSWTEQYLGMRCFAIPIRKLLLDQIHAIQKRISTGKMPPISSQFDCSCFKKYLLPCKYIFPYDYLFQSITSENWTALAEIFEKGGYKVDETMGSLLVQNREEDTHGDRTKRKQEVGAILEGIRACFFGLEEEVKELEEEEAHVVMTN